MAVASSETERPDTYASSINERVPKCDLDSPFDVYMQVPLFGMFPS